MFPRKLSGLSRINVLLDLHSSHINIAPHPPSLREERLLPETTTFRRLSCSSWLELDRPRFSVRDLAASYVSRVAMKRTVYKFT